MPTTAVAADDGPGEHDQDARRHGHGGLGGALAPVSSFPGWVQSVAPFTPAYWVLDALRRLTLEHATLADVAPATGIALAFAAGFALITALVLRSSAVKIGTT